ncbi:PH domain-containing protein [Georgenia faecalis]|uniref:PH domain-containing protein n=1 Tax=Georgenia faecalis TaxID=2483799 RepID=UPI000FDC4898|nr:PH domain-containing protein [Georgenia faecalis]
MLSDEEDRRPGGAAPQSTEEPTSQTWVPARRRQWAIGFSILGALLLSAAVGGAAVAGVRSGWDLVTPLLQGAYGVVCLMVAGLHLALRVRADRVGLHLVGPRGTTTYRWDDVVEVRPSIVRGKKTFLVLVLRDQQLPVDLPITEEHLENVRRWQPAGH